MQTLRIAQGHSTHLIAAPPAFDGIDMHNNVHFYLRREMAESFRPYVDREIAMGQLVLETGVTPEIVVLNRAAWSLAQCNVAGTA